MDRSISQIWTTFAQFEQFIIAEKCHGFNRVSKLPQINKNRLVIPRFVFSTFTIFSPRISKRSQYPPLLQLYQMCKSRLLQMWEEIVSYRACIRTAQFQICPLLYTWRVKKLKNTEGLTASQLMVKSDLNSVTNNIGGKQVIVNSDVFIFANVMQTNIYQTVRDSDKMMRQK